MALPSLDILQGQLADRKKGLQDAISRIGESDQLVHLLLRNCLPHLTEAEHRLLRYDLDLASQVQLKLLPKAGFTISAWETAYYYRPAGAVSGDYVDILGADGNDGCFCFVVGDVTGKGVAASILMSNLHAIFRSLTTSSMSVGPLLEQANRLFCEGTTSRYFATIVVGQATSSGELEISNAGHPSPVLIQGNSVRTVPSGGVPIGMFCRGSMLPPSSRRRRATRWHSTPTVSRKHATSPMRSTARPVSSLSWR